MARFCFFQFLESTLMGGRDQKIKRFLLFFAFLVDQIIGIRWYVPFLRSCGCCCVVSPRHRLFARFLRYHGYDSRAFWPTREVHPESRGEISNDQRTQSILEYEEIGGREGFLLLFDLQTLFSYLNLLWKWRSLCFVPLNRWGTNRRHRTFRWPFRYIPAWRDGTEVEVRMLGYTDWRWSPLDTQGLRNSEDLQKRKKSSFLIYKTWMSRSSKKSSKRRGSSWGTSSLSEVTSPLTF